MNLDALTGAVDVAAGQLAALDSRFLLPALVLQVLGLALRTFAWRGVLVGAYPGRRIPVRTMGIAYTVGVALNAFMPARGGELAKIAIVRSRIPGTTVPTIAGSMTVLLVLDAVVGGTLVLALWTTGSIPALPTPSALGPLGIALALAVAGALGLGYRLRPELVRRTAARVAQGFAVLRTPGRYLATVVPFQLAAWGCRIGVVFLVLSAFNIDASLQMATLVVVLSGAATATPVPGGAGTQQVLATYALHGVVSVATAVSFSVGMQVGVTAVNTTVGLVALMILFRTARPLAAMSSARALVVRTRADG
ncbi:MAG: lysylphosphatidylglycerol synthase transmembrane domain-containing protein [Gaiellaceae bacterium]